MRAKPLAGRFPRPILAPRQSRPNGKCSATTPTGSGRRPRRSRGELQIRNVRGTFGILVAVPRTCSRAPRRWASHGECFLGLIAARFASLLFAALALAPALAHYRQGPGEDSGLPDGETAEPPDRAALPLDRPVHRSGQPVLLLLRGPGLRPLPPQVLFLLPLHRQAVPQRP